VTEPEGVLLIEDDPDVGMLLVDVLESSGVPTTLRAEPRQLSDELQPRLVVTDLFCAPWYDRQCASSYIATLRQRFPNIPIVVLTGFSEAAQDVVTLGANRVVAKPFDIDALSQIVLSLYDGAASIRERESAGNVVLNP
jgi:two-component system C4-dicarboxylate transport response regulator DctD